jgi:hypothetical protein
MFLSWSQKIPPVGVCRVWGNGCIEVGYFAPELQLRKPGWPMLAQKTSFCCNAATEGGAAGLLPGRLPKRPQS